MDGASGRPILLALPFSIPCSPHAPPWRLHSAAFVLARLSSGGVSVTSAVLSTPDYAGMSRAAADFVCRFCTEHPRALVALPAGRTPRGMYRLLAREMSHRAPDASRLRFLNLDEYVGILPSDRRSFFAELHERFLDPLRIGAARVRLLNGHAGDLRQECDAYEQYIRDGGGIDLAILGIGTNGHIAFNEPGTSFDARTHVAALSAETRGALQRRFGRELPREGLTLGIATILEARVVLLLASGEGKARALRRAFCSVPTPLIPASALQGHPGLTVAADADALSGW